MFSVTFIANIVVMGIGGIMLLVGILLLGFGAYSLLKSRRAPDHEMPSYSVAVDYPSEPGMDQDFEDEPRWAGQFAGDIDSGSRGADGGRSVQGPATESDQVLSTRSNQAAAAGWWSKQRHGREKALIGVGALLILIGLYMLLNTIAMIA